jgi:hypothetical protein
MEEGVLIYRYYIINGMINNTPKKLTPERHLFQVLLFLGGFKNE